MQSELHDRLRGQLPANRLRELREEFGYKLYDVATRLRADPSTIHRWEQGRSPVPDEAKFALSELYGVTIAHLMGWPEEPVTRPRRVA